jgi:hypothetical protein
MCVLSYKTEQYHLEFDSNWAISSNDFIQYIAKYSPKKNLYRFRAKNRSKKNAALYKEWSVDSLSHASKFKGDEDKMKHSMGSQFNTIQNSTKGTCSPGVSKEWARNLKTLELGHCWTDWPYLQPAVCPLDCRGVFWKKSSHMGLMNTERGGNSVAATLFAIRWSYLMVQLYAGRCTDDRPLTGYSHRHFGVWEGD